MKQNYYEFLRRQVRICDRFLWNFDIEKVLFSKLSFPGEYLFKKNKKCIFALVSLRFCDFLC